VREGRFREDLYFRLNVLPVFVPPLRDRREDIPLLVGHFLTEALQRAPHAIARSIGDEAMHYLAAAPWTGNVRELASAIERAVVFSRDEMVGPQHLSALPPAGVSLTPTASWLPAGHDPPWTLKRLNQAYAEWVLAQSGGDKQRCAEILGIDLSTLYRWQRANQDGSEPSKARQSSARG
jgi:two-component system response regulator HydG